MDITKPPKFRHFRPCPHTLRRFHAFRRPLGVLPDPIANSSPTNAVSLSSRAQRTAFRHRGARPQIQIVRPSESIAETQANSIRPYRLSATVRSEIVERSITTTRGPCLPPSVASGQGCRRGEPPPWDGTANPQRGYNREDGAFLYSLPPRF
jgi:hypothetical protein